MISFAFFNRRARFVVMALCLLAGSAYGQDFQGLKSINGTRLYFTVKGKGTPLLIIHGGPGLNQSYLHPHLDELSDKFKLIFYDQRASGKSALPASDSLHLKFFAGDIDAICKEFGVEKISILAHSWGALQALQFAKDHRDKVSKLILCNPVPLSHRYDSLININQLKKATPDDSTDYAIIKGSKEFTSGSPEGYRKMLLLAFRHSFYEPDNIAKLKIDVPSNYKAASAALYTGLSPDMHYDYYKDLPSLPFEVLILQGADEPIPNEAIAKMISGFPHAKAVVFKKSGHFIFIEEPGKFKSEVERFLSRK